MSASEQIAAEQHHIDRAYRSLDAEIAQLDRRRTAALAQSAGDSTALNERDAEVRRLGSRLTALMRAEPNLSFGRIDRTDGLRVHIGPAGVRDGDDRLVIDWRAPAAAPFYAATAREPLGLARRRHLTLDQRTVVRVDDDLFGDADTAGAEGTEDAVGEGALLRALSASRDGRMHDAVATLQAEQDAIVRAPKAGVLVVQGAPGTGKTVVALHRAAYLLYSAPEVLRRGVLIIGPNTRFLNYIGDVLPALGETNVVTSTIEGLLPGLEATAPAEPETARLLGDVAMATAISSFVTALQGASEEDGHVISWDGDQIFLPRGTLELCTDRARKHTQQHNVAREVFRELILDELTSRVEQADSDLLAEVDTGFEDLVGKLDAALAKNSDALMPMSEGHDPDGEQALERRRLRAELAADVTVQRDLEELWPHLTPDGAVTRLLRDGLDAQTAPHLDEEERRLLAQSAEEPWTDAHVALLDEAAEILGEDDSDQVATAERAHQQQVAHAQRVIASTPGLAGLVSAQDLAERNTESDTRDLATRALADRSWTYGHVIVDEAQELTPMQWRMLARRCPVRSMTVVGDIAQTSAELASRTWSDRLAALRTTPRLEELTICYRSPRELVEAVEPLLRTLRPDAREIDAVRSAGTRPVIVDGDLDDAEQVLQWARGEHGPGQRVIITPAPQRLLAMLADQGIEASAEDLREPLVVLPPVAVKGLEFDHVLVHDPDRVADEDGLATLYVALTRATGTLTLIQSGPLTLELGAAWERRTLG
ncbi:UvrD-helicase domain-containing protein [Brachybacterium sp. FME24]|uniref:HelD family protein n=1 Tax=Brachybacterium sp. FME24 TaxID=2742605 RepID=UPI001865CBF6|nr:UvrD-helicase domain-containing protein [Brachybacterium sp. FME24]